MAACWMTLISLAEVLGVRTCKVPPLITKVSMAGFGAGLGAPKNVSKAETSLMLMKL